jgi:hypothetical protein
LQEIELAEIGSARDWDQGAGEGWVTYLSAGAVLCLVRCDLPLVIWIGQGNQNDSLASKMKEDIVHIRATDWDKSCYQLSSDILVLLNDWNWRQITHSEDGYICFTVSDLWWATI